jgi:hypothetical protein
MGQMAGLAPAMSLGGYHSGAAGLASPQGAHYSLSQNGAPPTGHRASGPGYQGSSGSGQGEQGEGEARRKEGDQ